MAGQLMLLISRPRDAAGGTGTSRGTGTVTGGRAWRRARRAPKHPNARVRRSDFRCRYPMCTGYGVGYRRPCPKRMCGCHRALSGTPQGRRWHRKNAGAIKTTERGMVGDWGRGMVCVRAEVGSRSRDEPPPTFSILDVICMIRGRVRAALTSMNRASPAWLQHGGARCGCGTRARSGAPGAADAVPRG